MRCQGGWLPARWIQATGNRAAVRPWPTSSISHSQSKATRSTRPADAMRRAARGLKILRGAFWSA